MNNQGYPYQQFTCTDLGEDVDPEDAEYIGAVSDCALFGGCGEIDTSSRTPAFNGGETYSNGDWYNCLSSDDNIYCIEPDDANPYALIALNDLAYGADQGWWQCYNATLPDYAGENCNYIFDGAGDWGFQGTLQDFPFSSFYWNFYDSIWGDGACSSVTYNDDYGKGPDGGPQAFLPDYQADRLPACADDYMWEKHVCARFWLSEDWDPYFRGPDWWNATAGFAQADVKIGDMCNAYGMDPDSWKFTGNGWFADMSQFTWINPNDPTYDGWNAQNLFGPSVWVTFMGWGVFDDDSCGGFNP